MPKIHDSESFPIVLNETLPRICFNRRCGTGSQPEVRPKHIKIWSHIKLYSIQIPISTLSESFRVKPWLLAAWSQRIKKQYFFI